MTAPGSQVRVFAEPDYRYGVGPLLLRIERIDWANPVRYDNEVWYPVEGVEVDRNGSERGRRQALVRGRRLQPPTTRGHQQA